jgi:hypothetical protein
VLNVIVEVGLRFNDKLEWYIAIIEAVANFNPEANEWFFAFWTRVSLPFKVLGELKSLVRVIFFIIKLCDLAKGFLIMLSSLILASFY